MSGLENMKRQILDEANHSAEEQISKARTKAEEILREAANSNPLANIKNE